MLREQVFLREGRKRSAAAGNRVDYLNGFIDGARYADTTQWVRCEDMMPEENEKITTRDDETMTAPVLCYICYGRDVNALRALRRVREDGIWRWMCDDLPEEYIKLWLPTPILPQKHTFI